MPFPGRGAAAQPPPQQPPAGAPPPPPGGQAPPAPPQPSIPDGWASIGGQVVQKTGAEIAQLPAGTQVCVDGQTWVDVATIAASAPQQAAQGGGWGNRAPAQQQQATQRGGWGNRSAGNGGRGKYAGVSNAEVGMARNPYLPEGEFIIRVVDSSFNQGRDHNAQIIEADVIMGDPNNFDGKRVTLYFKVNDSFLGNMKELVIAASGYDDQGNPRPREDHVTEEETEAMLDGEHPGIVGALLYVEARQIITRGGNPFTRYSFWPCVEDSTQEIGYRIPR